MFNYIASAMMGYLLVDVLRVPGQMNAETRGFLDSTPPFRNFTSCWRRSASSGR